MVEVDFDDDLPDRVAPRGQCLVLLGAQGAVVVVDDCYRAGVTQDVRHIRSIRFHLQNTVPNFDRWSLDSTPYRLEIDTFDYIRIPPYASTDAGE